jgi:hypothetical protein
LIPGTKRGTKIAGFEHIMKKLGFWVKNMTKFKSFDMD